MCHSKFDLLDSNARAPMSKITTLNRVEKLTSLCRLIFPAGTKIRANGNKIKPTAALETLVDLKLVHGLEMAKPN